MPIVQTDILIRTMLEAGINDLRKNPWVLDDVFGGLAQDTLSQVEYGYKEVKAAKDWFMEADIQVYLPWRVDAPKVPCISIMEQPKQERADRASLGDDGRIEDYEPRRATTQPQFIIPPFSPGGYEASTGTVTLPDGANTDLLGEGLFLVSARSGKAYVIKKVVDDSSFQIEPGKSEDFEGGYIVAPTQLWNLHREQAFLGESYIIGVHASSDPVICMWLRSLVAYCLFRYREAYLEARGWEISSLSIGPVEPNANFPGEKVYSAAVTLEGSVEASWIKFIAPKLYKTTGKIRIMDGPKTPPDVYEKQVKKQGWEMEGDAPVDVPMLGDDDPEDHE